MKHESIFFYYLKIYMINPLSKLIDQSIMGYLIVTIGCLAVCDWSILWLLPQLPSGSGFFTQKNASWRDWQHDMQLHLFFQIKDDLTLRNCCVVCHTCSRTWIYYTRYVFVKNSKINLHIWRIMSSFQSTSEGNRLIL